MIIDQAALRELLANPPRLPGSRELSRAGKVFFVGGDLPVNQTLETMFESFCMESTDLFLITFGSLENFHQGEEMARQIKKNFNVRLMGRLPFIPPERVVERIYAAGVDILDIPPSQRERNSAEGETKPPAVIPGHVFPRWAVAATLEMGEETCGSARTAIDSLLHSGIVPLVALTSGRISHEKDEIAALYRHLAAGWKSHRIPMKPFRPLISLLTPLQSREPRGVLSGIIGRIHDRQMLVASDLRRHLRVRVAEDSLDSAGL